MANWHDDSEFLRLYYYGGCPEQREAPEPLSVDPPVIGRMERFASGAQRDTQDGKVRYDLISPLLLERVARHLTDAAKHYGEHNWHQGIPSQRYMASLMRHVEQYRAGDRSEDHLSAIVFNSMGLMHNEGTELDDLYEW